MQWQLQQKINCESIVFLELRLGYTALNCFAEKKYQSENIDEKMNKPSIHDNYMYPAEDFPDVYHIFRNFICRRAHLDKEGFNTMVEYMVKYLEHTQLTSSVIRQAAGSLCTLRPQHNLSTIVDRMVTYLLNNRMHVHTITLLRPMQLIYFSNDNISDSPKGKSPGFPSKDIGGETKSKNFIKRYCYDVIMQHFLSIRSSFL